MIRKTKHLIVALFVVLSAGMVAMPAVAGAATPFKSDVCSGLTQIGGNCSENSSSTISNVFKLIINILSIVVGFVAVVMIIVSGFKFITASGDSSSIASARSTIIYALVGLVIAVLAQVLVHFVLFRVSNCGSNPKLPANSAQCK